MRNRRVLCSRVLALVLPAALALSCIERDWSVCSPQDECQSGYTCTADWKCVREVDGGDDGLVAVDSRSTADAGGGGLDGPAPAETNGPGGDAPGPDAADSPAPAVPDAAIDTTSELDSSGGAGGSGGGLDAAAGTPGLDGPGSVDSGGGGPDAAADVPAAHPDAPSLSALAASCSADSGCASGNCADGVCCDKPCSGCNACTNDLTGKADGTCSFVGVGQNPHRACADETATNPCGSDGTCDGKGSCHYPAVGTACGDPSCTGSTLTTKACDSTHTCAPTSTLCPQSTACDGNTCGSKKAAGAACTTGTECASGKCADNLDGTSRICCASACSTCQGCKSDGSACTRKNAGAADSACGTTASCQTGTCNSGTCQQAAAGTNCGANLYCTGDGQCTCQAGGVCQPTAAPCMQGTYSCSTGAPVCTATVAWGTDHPCGLPQSCSGTTKNLAQKCNGSGQCSAQTSQGCIYRCNSQGTDCDDTNYCSPNPCLNGGSCANTTSTYTCTCTGGWGGPTCATKLFEGLGMLSIEYGYASYANAVSADGTIVVGEVDGAANEVSTAFKWTSATGMTALASSSGAPDTVATAFSAGGIVGRGLLLPVALFWTGTLEHDLNDLSGNGSYALGISNNGTIVGHAWNASSAYGAVRWTSSYAQPVVLDTAGTYPYSSAAGISLDGSTIVGTTSSGAFKWTLSSGIVLLSGGANTTANAASANGGVIVGSLNPLSSPPVFWNGASRTSLGTGVGEAFAVNSDGSVIVGIAANDAFIWDSSNGRRSLAAVLTTAGADLTGWNLNKATGIATPLNSGKVIVGWGSHNGTEEAWIARLP